MAFFSSNNSAENAQSPFILRGESNEIFDIHFLADLASFGSKLMKKKI